MPGVVLTVVTVVLTVVVAEVVAVVAVVTVWSNVVQLPPPLGVSADVLNSPPLVRQSDQQEQHIISNTSDQISRPLMTKSAILSQLKFNKTYHPPKVIIELRKVISVPI